MSLKTLQLLFRIICDINLNTGVENFGQVAQEIQTAKEEIEQEIKKKEK